MKNKPNFLSKIPIWVSSKASIFIYLFLFFYLVIFAIFCVIIPDISHLQPSNTVQSVFGNYATVLSALSASIAAGGGVIIHSKVKELHERHDKLHESHEKLHDNHEKLQKSIDELHKKLEKNV